MTYFAVSRDREKVCVCEENIENGFREKEE
jgi:hypothetical protein